MVVEYWQNIPGAIARSALPLGQSHTLEKHCGRGRESRSQKLCLLKLVSQDEDQKVQLLLLAFL
ncbi:MAG: hypothetical protein KME30_31720 [Iphinoe sp. HA4291-MV1]|nr:hypothetical protein [Iphinoe sp. HA4291-MV1]